MSKYPQHMKLLLLLLLCPLALGMEQEQLEPLHRNKRTLTTICVEIQPSGPQNEPYFMCKGADFSNSAAPTSAPQAADQQQQPVYNYSPPAGAQMSPQVPFPSFPSFGAGFFPAPQNYEDAYAPKATPATSGHESHGAQYGAPAAAAFTPASSPQSYGMSAVPYPAPGGPAAAARGTFAGSSPAATPISYADAGAKKPTSAGQTAPMRKSQPSSGQTSNGNAYESLVDNRHRVAMDDSVLAMPNVGFQPEELNAQYRRPDAGMEPPMMLMQLHQPAPVPHPYYDDHIMRTFYASLGHQEPQVAQATPLHQAAPIEPLVAQDLQAAAPEYSIPYTAAATNPEGPPPSAPPVPPAQPMYNAYPKPSSSLAQTSPVDGNACNSCNRPCSAPAETCPSFQPVIIAMPCYGQQQPTHYLAVPGSAGPSAPGVSRESIVGSPFGAPFGMSPQVGSPFGLGQHVGGHFGMGSQAGPAYGMSAPQVGSPFGMGPQVGGPFGMAPMLNPFGPFGSLNPFNPFNRILGAPAPTTPQPRLRLFGAADEGSTPTTTATTSTPTAPQFQQPTAKSSNLNIFSTSVAPPTRLSTEAADASVGASLNGDGDQKDDHDDEEDENEDASKEVTELPHASDTTDDDASPEGAELSKSLEFDELVKKGEDKLKVDKRKRQNSRYSNNNSQKRKYLQRL